jgi:hypothetical protein
MFIFIQEAEGIKRECVFDIKNFKEVFYFSVCSMGGMQYGAKQVFASIKYQ